MVTAFNNITNEYRPVIVTKGNMVRISNNSTTIFLDDHPEVSILNKEFRKSSPRLYKSGWRIFIYRVSRLVDKYPITIDKNCLSYKNFVYNLNTNTRTLKTSITKVIPINELKMKFNIL